MFVQLLKQIISIVIVNFIYWTITENKQRNKYSRIIQEYKHYLVIKIFVYETIVNKLLTKEKGDKNGRL